MVRRLVLPLDRSDCREAVVKNDMKLRSNTSRLKVYDQGNLRGMHIRQSDEDTTSRTWFPARKFLAGLKFWVQNVHRTTPNMKVAEAVARYGTSGEDIRGAQSFEVGCCVVNVCCIVDSLGPERRVDAPFPMKTGMQEHRPRHVRNRLDRALGDSILMVSVRPTVPNLLLRLLDVTNKLVCLECARIGKVFLDDDAGVERKLFEVLLRTNRFDSGKTKLMFDMHIAGCMVDEDTATNILIGGKFPVRIVGPALQTRLKMID